MFFNVTTRLIFVPNGEREKDTLGKNKIRRKANNFVDWIADVKQTDTIVHRQK